MQLLLKKQSKALQDIPETGQSLWPMMDQGLPLERPLLVISDLLDAQSWCCKGTYRVKSSHL